MRSRDRGGGDDFSEFVPTADAELAVDGGEVVLDRSVRQAQTLRDLAIACACGGGAGDGPLARGGQLRNDTSRPYGPATAIAYACNRVSVSASVKGPDGQIVVDAGASNSARAGDTKLSSFIGLPDADCSLGSDPRGGRAGSSLVGLPGCARLKEDKVTPAEARDALVTTIEDSAAKLDDTGWNRDHAPEVGDCDGQQGERANFTYGYGAPAPNSDRGADAKIIADYWMSLGMQVRVVDTPLYVVYASGGPVSGLSFSTAPGDYYIARTSLCVPGDGAEIRKQDNG